MTFLASLRTLKTPRERWHAYLAKRIMCTRPSRFIITGTLPRLSTSVVRFKPLSDDEISAYCATGEPMGKAVIRHTGAAAAFVEYMEGSYTGIVGLPAYETATC